MDRPPGGHADAHALYGSVNVTEAFERDDTRAREIERRDPPQTFFGRDPWHPRVHHHDARHEPQDEEQAAGDAEPAMCGDQCPPECVH